MPEYLVETYAPRASATRLSPDVDEISLAADQVSEQGEEVQFLRAIFVPEEETCFYHYRSVSADAVRAAAARAGLRFERITTAVSSASRRSPPAGG